MRLSKFRFNRVKKPKRTLKYIEFLKSKSPALIGLHYKLQRLSVMLGYTKERDDTWQAMSPDEIQKHQREWQRLSEIFTPIRSEYNQQHGSKTFHREETIEQGEIDMSKQKMGFRDMMDWATEHSKFDSKNVFIKFSEGVHIGRLLNIGNDPEYDNGIERFFRSFQVHDMGQKQTFWSGLCLDYVMDNKQGIRKYLIQNKKINKAEGEKIKTNGCVACTTLEVLEKEYGLSRKDLNQILRTKTRIIAPFFYIRQFMPEPVDDRGKVKQGVVPTGLYVWEMSPSGLKKVLQSLERFVKLEVGDDEIDEDSLLEYFELDSGLNLAVGAEGEGVGKNSREYTFEFKGERGKLKYRDMPYGREKSELRTFDPEVVPPHKLYAIEADKFMTYQQMANKMLFLPGDTTPPKPTELGKILHQIGYEIPAFEVSDNPLDDNFSQGFADKVLGAAKQKVLGINPVKNVHAEKARQRQAAKEEEENKPWDEDEEDTKIRPKPTKDSRKKIEVEEDDEEEEEETPRSKKSSKESPKPVSKSKAKKVEEEEEDFEATDDDTPWSDSDDVEIEGFDEEDEEEEEEKPKPKAKKKDKFEEMVEPSDEEEEEEKPKKSGQKKNRRFF